MSILLHHVLTNYHVLLHHVDSEKDRALLALSAPAIKLKLFTWSY